MLPENQKQRENQSQGVADGLSVKNSVNAQKQREDIQERNQEYNLPQHRNHNRGDWFAQRLEKGSGQHDEAENRCDAEIDSQPRDTDSKHFFTAAESHKNLSREKHDNHPDDTGDADRQGSGQIQRIHDPPVSAGAKVVPDNRLDSLADAAGRHDNKSHDTGNDGINADSHIAAIAPKLAVVYQTDKAHGHLGDPESKTAGNDLRPYFFFQLKDAA